MGERNDAAVAAATMLAATIFLAPALGARDELMLQDTLKSIVVAFGALAAGIACFWPFARRHESPKWHSAMWLPLALMAYALGSMTWSHTYLAGVEAIRWFLFALIVFVGINSFTRERLPWLAWGVFGGGLVASVWAAMQFWFDVTWFPQGPAPASTFINRNFFAEFAICTLPFGAMLLARARKSQLIALLAVANAVVIVAVLMTGTRAALIALWLQLLVLFPYVAIRFREQFAFDKWSDVSRVVAIGLLFTTVLGLGMLPTGNPAIEREGRGLTALERGLGRTASIAPGDPSLALRMVMWKATLRVIEARPLSGVGAGAWESEVPLYQEPGAQLETDFYVHNEFLQLIAEYGLIGWAFLAGLLAWFYLALKSSVLDRTEAGAAEGPWRSMVLCSLASFMVVSQVGFPWRMAATGALFAICLGVLAASDNRLRIGLVPREKVLSRGVAYGAIASLSLAAALAAYISLRAAQAEQKLVTATLIAFEISASGAPNDARWNGRKQEMLNLAREGIALNPHYRKITPLIGDELGRWGHWREAVTIWESVLASRPNIVVIMTNAARGHLVMGNVNRAQAWLDKALAIQPKAKSVLSLQVLLLGYTGQDRRALDVVRTAIADNNYDFDLVNFGYAIAVRAGDQELAQQAFRLRAQGWPQMAQPTAPAASPPQMSASKG
ncbi:O-antigen ligase family protein [Caenimonas sp. SL110]|uniref:O-antigen ligase family protein n=1 Tax=Caenimonas sp. SL110 TaxID=1450524 RepID=UPI0006549A8A|nr:O-antigen ligase family protein [Caenimonas sp. SL110]